MNYTISTPTVILMVTLALLNTIVPITMAYIYRKRYEVKISTFFIGMICYILFGMLLIQVPDLLLRGGIKPLSALVKNSPIAAALYFSLITVLMEEFGRLFIYKTMMKKRMTKEESLMLGSGHGGIQAMLTGSSVMMTNAILAFSINSFGAEEYLKKLKLTGEQLETTRKGIVEFSQIPPVQHFFDGTVPLLLLCGQVALSYIVFRSIANKELRFLYPVGIVMHFLLLIPLYLVRKNVVSNFLIGETIMLIIVLAIIYFAYRLYQKETRLSVM